MNRQIGARRRKVLGQVIGGIRQVLGVPPRLIDHPTLGPKFREILTVLGNTLFPPGGEIPYSAEDVQVTEYICEYFRRIPAREADLLCLSLLLYEHGIPKLMGRGWRFSKMQDSARIELMEALHDSSVTPLRMLNFSLRMILGYGYMADERVLKEMNFYKRHAYANDKREIELHTWDRAAAEAAIAAVDAEAAAREEAPAQKGAISA